MGEGDQAATVLTAGATSNDSRFIDYYARESATGRARDRAVGLLRAIERSRRLAGLATRDLEVADVGCNAGTQSRVWLERGHSVRGLDISRELVAIAQERNAEFGARARFEVGTAVQLPWPSGSFDICLLPELLEHVENWRPCLSEAARILRPGGSLFVSTTNWLCPVQQEFTLPLYSWYPAPLKRHFERLAVSTRPELVNFATYPAVHWFSPYGLARELRALGLSTRDRFDLIDEQAQGTLGRVAVHGIRSVPPLRFMGHLATPSTVLLAHKLALA